MTNLGGPASRHGKPGELKARHAACTLLCIVAAALWLAGCAPPQPIRIGYLGPLSGRASDLGISGLYGARLAVDQHNAAGISERRRIELIEADDRHDPETARLAFHRLADRGVAAVIGPMTNAIAYTLQPHANERRILLISPTVSSTQLSQNDDYFIRTSPNASDFATATAHHLKEHTAIKRIRPVIDLSNTAYSRSWLRDFSSAFRSENHALLEPIAFVPDETTDFNALARRALTENPDGILLTTQPLDTAILAQSIRRRHATVELIATESAGTPRLIELGDPWIEGLRVAQAFDANSAAPAYGEFLSAYSKAYGQPPGFAATNAYDAANILIDLLSTGTPAHDLKRAILAKKTFQGRQSHIVIDAYGDAQTVTYIATVRHGQFVREAN